MALRRIVPYNTIVKDGIQMEHSKASLKPKTGEVEVGSSPDVPHGIVLDVPGEAPDAPQGTTFDVPKEAPDAPHDVGLNVPKEVTTGVETNGNNGPPDDPDTYATVLRRSSRIRKTPDRLGF